MTLRLTICYLLMLPAFFITNEIMLTVLCGAFIVPILGFLIPMLIDFIYNIRKLDTR